MKKLFLMGLALSGLSSASSLPFQEVLQKTRLELGNSAEFQLAQQNPQYAGYVENETGAVLNIKGAGVLKQDLQALKTQAADLKADIAAKKMPAYKGVSAATVNDVTYSYNDLVNSVAKIRYLNQNKKVLEAISINTAENKVELTTSSKKLAAAKQLLAQNNIPEGSYILQVKNIFFLSSGSGGSKNYGTLTDNQRPIVPGVQIDNEFNPGGYCSAGYVAAGTSPTNGQVYYGIVTARHCISATSRDQYFSNLMNVSFYQPTKVLANRINQGMTVFGKKGSGVDAVFLPLTESYDKRIPVTDPGSPTITGYKNQNGAYTGLFENVQYIRHVGRTSYYKVLMKGRDFNKLYPLWVQRSWEDYLETPNVYPGEVPFYNMDTKLWCFDYLMSSRDTRYPLVYKGDSGSGVYDDISGTTLGILSTMITEGTYPNFTKATACIQDWTAIQRDLNFPVVPVVY